MKKLLYFFTIILFSLASCEVEEPDECDAITCENGGTCSEGICDCPERYIGPLCSEETLPTTVRISQVVITKYPPYPPSGGVWDVGDGPDLYIKIEQNGVVLYESSGIEVNNAGSGNHTITIDPVAVVASAGQPVKIELYDFDTNTVKEYMDRITFTGYTRNTGFPTSRTHSSPYSTAVITCSYTF